MESKAVLEAFQEATGQKAVANEIDDRIYFELGEVNGARTFMVRSEMGAGGLGAAQQAVQKGIEALSPVGVIMVGIAFGVDEQKQAIGDILVTEQLRGYEMQRVGKHDEIVLRSDKPSASPWLLNRLKSADLMWEGAEVRFGVVLTGEKLVDNVDFREQLRGFEPEAIGGEMEGAGLYAACQDKKVDWILVKAICDWADGQKGKDKQARQQTAADNAARFVLHALEFAPFKPPKTRPNSITQAPIAEPEERLESHSSLPIQPFFFGREKELASIADAILPESRTWGVLIDGPGGIGKTALAIEAGHRAPAAQYPRKIFLSAKVRQLTPVGEEKLEDFMLPNFLALVTELGHELGEPGLARTLENERVNAVRRALTDQRALLVIDNVETFDEKERLRLVQFLNHLPSGCKAIVTSRRRADVDARVIRLDRLEQKDALALLGELAKRNRILEGTTEQERQSLYEITGGNPLLLRWTAGQLGRRCSQCRTVAEACAFLENAPPENDPLEYIFGDLLDTFTESETAVLAALTHFTQPARVTWIADLADLGERQAQTALEDLDDRALLVGDPAAEVFSLPRLAAAYLRAKRPETVAQTGDRLADRAYALALENGYEQYETFPVIEAEWPTLEAALPRLAQGENARLQKLCSALETFLDFSGRWDEWLWLSKEAEDKALATSDFHNAGWRAYYSGWVYFLRGQGAEVLTLAARTEAHWKQAKGGAQGQATATYLRGVGHELEENYPDAKEGFQHALALSRTVAPESDTVSIYLNSLANNEQASRDYAAAERHYSEAFRISERLNDREGVAMITGNLGSLAFDREDWPAAERLAREALHLSEAVGRKELVASDCMMLAKALSQQDRPSEALPYAQRSVEIYTHLRSPKLEAAQAVLDECQGRKDADAQE